MPFADPSFWGGAGATGITAGIALWIRRITAKETLEERLQRWQSEVVREVRTENQTLRVEIKVLKDRGERLFVIEACLRLVVTELRRLDPKSQVLDHVGAMLARAIPVEEDTPDELIILMNEAERAVRQARRGKQ